MHIWRKTVTPAWLRNHRDLLLNQFGQSLAIVERPDRKRASIEISCRAAKQAETLLRGFGGTVVKLPPNWLQQFNKHSISAPLRIGSRLLVLRSKRPANTPSSQSGVRSIVIPAEAAFGTGEHATTAMCLRFLERITRSFVPDWRMLDAGTGSGILAIAGSCFGASQVIAIDSDPIACRTAKRNAYANGIRNVQVFACDVLGKNLSGRYDVITANIFSEVIIEALPRWARQTTAGGYLILSGILRSQEKEVLRALEGSDFRTLQIHRRGKWVALLAELRRRKKRFRGQWGVRQTEARPPRLSELSSKATSRLGKATAL